MKKFDVVSDNGLNEFGAKVDYMIISCNHCGWHWGVSLANRDEKQLTARDLVCQKCAADKVAQRN